MKIEICPVCGSPELVPSFTTKDYYATHEEFEVWQCKSCGFLFTQNFPDGVDMARYYETDDYISHSNTNKGLVNKIYHAVRSYMMNKKAVLVKNNSAEGAKTILDFGCGIGFFLNKMKKNGFEIKGIDVSETARKYATTHFDIETFAPEKLSDFIDGSFDIITSWHSLEHVEALNEILKQFRRVLADNGTLFVAVPNAKSEDAAYYKETWAAYDVPRHLWHFTPPTVRILAKNAGFKVEKMLPMPFDAFYISMLSEKYRKHSFSFIRGFWVGLRCYLKSRKKTDKSSSIIYILKKK